MVYPLRPVSGPQKASSPQGQGPVRTSSIYVFNLSLNHQSIDQKIVRYLVFDDLMFEKIVNGT